MRETALSKSAEIVGYLAIPKSIYREGQFIVNAVGDCMSARPEGGAVYEGDKLLIRPTDPAELKGGELIVMDTNFGTFAKEYICKCGSIIFVGCYRPVMRLGFDEDEVKGIYKVDAVIRDGNAVAVGLNNAQPFAVGRGAAMRRQG